ncbi:protein ACCELERATED CELL DEATH 6-like [Eucalyptus grandis]|uniref:protein ACCELERATED CELL DEATH 6-like n=1 Tax=Eucalyptus grandis TaxID=71139 RepID=UPI00192F0A64|nr:protein ACCELERATED CELL DEATH 6-like [Eucalyptus grandis]XP_039160415.1 protein ACCELERATED CELL DEATH 6-like [Eucalyptus grandis]XP_039160416.1 protein ACCELERATED CELL DEATH 6-like [Eucalyptus grandis]
MGHVLLIKKLYRESQSVNKRGQTVLHLAAKYGRASVVRYILRDSELGKLINERDYDGNTALHLAVMHSQLAALIPLVLDTRIDPRLLNHRDFTAFDIALDRIRKEYTFQKLLAFTLLRSVSPKSSADQIILKREARHEAFPVFFFIGLNEKLSDLNQLRDDVNTRLVVATLVTTVTFAAGFAVPGGFNSSDTASKDYRGMATMLDKRMFQSFAICNTIAMFCSMTSVVNLMLAHRSDAHLANAACWRATVSLSIALPAMSAAFLTGVILTVDKLPWLATTILILGYVFLLIITGGSLSQFFAPFIQCFPFFWRRLPPIRPLLSWFFLASIFFLGGETSISDDSEVDKTASETSASRALDGGGED